MHCDPDEGATLALTGKYRSLEVAAPNYFRYAAEWNQLLEMKVAMSTSVDVSTDRQDSQHSPTTR